MRPFGWLTIGLVLAGATIAAPAPAADEGGHAYRTLSDLPVMHRGRLMPLHTLAIDEVKQIYSRETIKLRDAGGKVVSEWDPVAALLDWSARPEFWDKQEFIIADVMDYQSFKRFLLADTIKDELRAIAGKPGTSADDRKAIEAVVARDEIADRDLEALLKTTRLAAEDRATVEARARTLSPGHKWLSPADLENATVNVDGHETPFIDWFGEIVRKRQEAAQASMGGEPKLPPIEQKVAEVGNRLFHYQAIRDHNQRGIEQLDILVMPRPSNEAYLKYSTEAVNKLRDSKSEGALTPLEMNALAALQDFMKDLRNDEKALPGEDKEFDARFTKWLRENSAWVPLRVLLSSEEEELVRAGFPAQELASFRAAFAALEAGEAKAPGDLAESPAQGVIASARAMADRIGGTYPSPATMARETHYNRFAPFYWAPWAYFPSLILLLASLALALIPDPPAAARKVRKVLYWAGLSAFVVGIALEIYGFYLRVVISGYAPVSNMYETVIWVALVAAILALVFELIWRKTLPAVGGAAIAAVTTILAYNVQVAGMESDIRSLQPVLRDNFWLTIHVLSIVSSYAAFALALGLGLVGLGFYLTATYRRSATLRELAVPLLPGLPLLVLGSIGVYGSYQGWAPGVLDRPLVFYTLALLTLFGGVAPTIIGTFGVFGELSNRAPHRALALVAPLTAVGALGWTTSWLHLGPAWAQGTAWTWSAAVLTLIGSTLCVLALFGFLARATYRKALRETQALDQAASAGAAEADSGEYASAAASGADLSRASAGSSSGGGTATLSRPTVAEIRSRAASNRPTLDARGRAMQTTAGWVKLVASLIYRVMQVGVLLVAAGTILGGVWADYSWGRFWGWDPKEVWALITLLVYLVPLHGRFAGWINTFGLTCCSVACFMSVLMAWYGVNFVLGVGLHSYGFAEGGGQGVVASVTVAVLAVVGATMWRRSLCSRPAAGV